MKRYAMITFHHLYTLCFNHEKKSFYNNRVLLHLVENREWKTKWVEVEFYKAAFLFLASCISKVETILFSSSILLHRNIVCS